MSKKFWYSNN